MKHIDKKGHLTNEFINFIKSHETVRRTDTGELRRGIKVDQNLREKLRKEFNIHPNKEVKPAKKRDDNFWDGEVGRIYLAMEEKDAAESRLSKIKVSGKDKKDLGLQHKLTLTEKENQQLREDKKKYSSEKSRAGSNSYKPYKPLRDKVKELCREEMQKTKKPKSASQLCSKISKKVESDYKELLNNFKPYKKWLNDGGDWLRPTFYDWCNDVFKSI